MKCLPSCSYRNPGAGCSSAPLAHPSRWAFHEPGTWRRGTSGADGHRSYCEKIKSHNSKKFQIFKENSHNFKTIGTLNTYRKQWIGTDISVYSAGNLTWKVLGSKGLIFSPTLDIVMTEDLERHVKVRGDSSTQGEGPWLWAWILAQPAVWLWANYLTHPSFSL